MLVLKRALIPFQSYYCCLLAGCASKEEPQMSQQDTAAMPLHAAAAADRATAASDRATSAASRAENGGSTCGSCRDPFQIVLPDQLEEVIVSGHVGIVCRLYGAYRS